MDPRMDKQARYFLEVLKYTSNEAITMVNVEGEVLFWNMAAERTYQIKQEEIIGRKIKDFFRQEDLVVLKMLETEQPVRSIYHRPRPDKHVLINSAPVYDDEGRLIGAIAVEQDISQLVKLNEELSDASLQLDQLKSAVSQNHAESPFSRIKGKSRAIQEAIQLAMKVAKTDATVLITGESGVGKELFARAIHEASLRHHKPFVPINCGAIPLALFESELFGYEAGAFTGATKEGKKGKIELANGGTLFLDEVGELPMEMQVKLLRVLQEREVYRIGGTKPIPVNIRVLAASNRNLEQMVAEGSFREDLYYRLNVVSLSIPPLRERLEDIPELVQMFVNEFAAKYQKPTPSLDSQVIALFLQYHWPGNIRQLRNVVERLIILTDGNQINQEDVRRLFPVAETKAGRPSALVTKPMTHLATVNQHPLQAEKAALEKQRIEQALQETYGNKSAAAKKLGISRATLYKKLKAYGISWKTNED
ncbi:sigma-54-dependent Fis family transcriptional regulator [Caldalkalibacillus thermarum]|uniref:sigma-54 interaction domain-containing protein n=1 Tax=Caldalkalibacillus thermarum TaxID=296745 RepID=UPI00198A3941|nr:sigma 54-interacting transcriptional regulator [Caldalkalibacillus thermarum]GGK32388.1 sigma-54-dependent Fis family transcriptional regulator [Caldalkalibacillus thermarum]